jgi:hypothetical protein
VSAAEEAHKLGRRHIREPLRSDVGRGDGVQPLTAHRGQVLELLHREHVTIEVRQERLFARSKAMKTRTGGLPLSGSGSFTAGRAIHAGELVSGQVGSVVHGGGIPKQRCR